MGEEAAGLSEPVRQGCSRCTPEAFVGVLDHKPRFQPGDFTGQPGQLHRIEHGIKVLVGRRSFVTGVGMLSAWHTVGEAPSVATSVVSLK